METIKKRAEFIASSKGDKFVTPSFIFLKHKLNGDYVNDPKVGYTASKKIGGAVMRNRAKRRMRFLAKKYMKIVLRYLFMIYIRKKMYMPW